MVDGIPMRDADRIREKSDLRLDDRQVAGLAVAVLLLLGGVFALGLMVGKSLAARAPQAAPAGDLAALDEQHAAEPVRPAEKPAPAPEPAPKVAQSSVGAPPVEQDGPTRPAAVTAAPAPVTVVTSHKPVVVDPPKAVVVRPPHEPALTPPPRDLGAFTVQIGASPDRAEALRLESRARAAGLRPYVVEAHLGAKGTWYRVRVGSFKDKDSAGRYRKDVERELRASAVVMPAR